MKPAITRLCLLAATAFTSSAGDDHVYPALGETEIKVEAVLNAEGIDGDPLFGGEVAFGQSLFDFDLLSLFVGLQENSDIETTVVGFQIDEHYHPEGWPLVPYAGLGLGYTWNQVDNANDSDSILVRGELGAKVRLCNSFSVSGAVRYEWTEYDAVYKDNGESDDKNWSFSIGLRYTY